MKPKFSLEGELWRDHAACINKPTSWFFTLRDWNNHGRRCCAGCPVLEVCAEYRMVHRMEGGWGGVYIDPKRRRKEPA